MTNQRFSLVIIQKGKIISVFANQNLHNRSYICQRHKNLAIIQVFDQGMKNMIFGVILLAFSTGVHAQTIEECQKAAEQNYPLIKQYDLIAQTTDLTVKNIQKGWLPQMGSYAQATYQSDVVSWPATMKATFSQMGVEMKGLTKDQYKVGIDLQQVIYDGGAMSSQSLIARQQGKVQKAQNEVNLYQVRKRVNEMFFALLMLDEQLKLNDDVRALLLSSERQLTNMVRNGTAATSDLEKVKAERLNAEQQNVSLKSQRAMVQEVLGAFCGIAISSPQKPSAVYALSQANHRPEMWLFDAQVELANAQAKGLRSQLMPRLDLFAQGYYGYPGLNMFEDMMSHDWSLNGLVGVKLSWKIGALYTHKNDKAKLEAQRQLVESNRETFIFNNRLEQMQQNESIQRYSKMLQSDDEIITLRTSVRKAAESKLAHGIIDVNDLLREINNENSAKIQQSIHEIDMLKEMYNQKYTTNE